MAVQRGNFEVVQTLLEKNADPNAKDDIGEAITLVLSCAYIYVLHFTILFMTRHQT